MKKLTTTLVAGVSLLGAVAASYGQGEIQFANNTSQTAVTFGNVQGTSYSASAGQRAWGPASSFEYALYLGPVGATSYTQMTLVDTVYSPNATSGTTGFAGAIAGGTLSSTTGGNVSGFVGGQTYSDIVLAWTHASGSSFDAALNSSDPNALTGMSAIGQVTANLAPSPAGQVFGTAGGGQIGTGFTLNAVPEPTTIALSGLGAAALLLFRRRK